MFADRTEAGARLAARLAHLADQNTLVLAIPRGGVPVALPIARHLAAPLDVLLLRKIGAPGQPELAIGAVMGDRPEDLLLDDAAIRDLAVSQDHLDHTIAEERTVLARRRDLYRPGLPPVDVAGRRVVLVDDGVATGLTLRLALHALATAKAARVVLAVPVAPRQTAAALATLCDEAVVLETPDPFFSVGDSYADFRQLTDDEVVGWLAERPRR